VTRRAPLAFDRVCTLSGLPTPIAEYRFALVHGRQWRFDYAWPGRKVAIEIDGGLWIHGRHQRPAGVLSDNEKRNTAQIDGWIVLTVTPQQVASGAAVALVRRALAARTENR
jgi:hypothetical protein